MFIEKTIKVFFRPLLIIAAVLLAVGCANVVAPQGGPKDEDPPKIIRSEPSNFSTNYDGSDIRIYFDEFIRLHNLRQKMMVSPPLEKLPEVRIKRRSIIITVEEELMENTTYNFFFGDAIQDITENNPIPNFSFVVSTGDYVDSLSVRGKVLDAFDLNPAEDVYVMMYDNIYDSVPYKELPVYISRTDKEGRFVINNMRKGEYLMFALKDLNFNYIFDQPGESIAFLDSLVTPQYIPIIEKPEDDEEEPDEDEEIQMPGLQEDSKPELQPDKPDQGGFLHDDNDTIEVSERFEANFYNLYLFTEKDTVQRLSAVSFDAPGKLTFAFRIPYDSAYVEEYRNPFDSDWKISEFSKNKDSLFVWLVNVERDSLFLKVWDGENLIDSVKRSVRSREALRRRVEEPELTITSNYQTGKPFPYFKKLVLTANNPLKIIDYERIDVIVSDSIPIESVWEFYGEANRKLIFEKEFEQETKYKFIIPDSTLTDIYGLLNKDTLNVAFTTSAYENYGIIMLNLTLPEENQNYILQLMGGQDKILKEKFITKSGEYIFPKLPPGNYGFKVIVDKNNNGKWDTGNYLKGIQPEPVFIMDEKINVRQNWEHEVIWSFE